MRKISLTQGTLIVFTILATSLATSIAQATVISSANYNSWKNNNNHYGDQISINDNNGGYNLLSAFKVAFGSALDRDYTTPNSLYHGTDTLPALSVNYAVDEWYIGDNASNVSFSRAGAYDVGLSIYTPTTYVPGHMPIPGKEIEVYHDSSPGKLGSHITAAAFQNAASSLDYFNWRLNVNGGTNTTRAYSLGANGNYDDLIHMLVFDVTDLLIAKYQANGRSTDDIQTAYLFSWEGQSRKYLKGGYPDFDYDDVFAIYTNIGIRGVDEDRLNKFGEYYEEGNIGGGESGGGSNITPEPASILIFGLGLAGIPLLRHFQNKNRYSRDSLNP